MRAAAAGTGPLRLPGDELACRAPAANGGPSGQRWGPRRSRSDPGPPPKPATGTIPSKDALHASHQYFELTIVSTVSTRGLLGYKAGKNLQPTTSCDLELCHARNPAPGNVKIPLELAPCDHTVPGFESFPSSTVLLKYALQVDMGFVVLCVKECLSMLLRALVAPTAYADSCPMSKQP